MNCFIGVVNNMDQMVMVFSLLCDVFLVDFGLDNDVGVEVGGSGGCLEECMFLVFDLGSVNGSFFVFFWDMYSYYVLFKFICNDIEWGVLYQLFLLVGSEEGSVWKFKDILVDLGYLEGVDVGEEDLEQQFYYYLCGLYIVFLKFMCKVNIFINRYKQEIGFGNWGY